MIRDTAETWARERSPVSALRAMRDADGSDGSDCSNGFNRALWAQMVELGWAGILIPVRFGGSGLGMMELGLVLEQTARTLTASPLLSTALTVTSALLSGASEQQQQRWLPGIASGQCIAALAVDEGTHHQPRYVQLRAQRTGSGYALTGSKLFVIDGSAADLLLVAARTAGQPADEHGITLFLVRGGSDGLTRTRLKTIDSRGVADLQFNGVTAPDDAVLGPVDGGWPLLQATLDRACVGLSAEMLGHATQCFDLTLEYLKTRIQFDRPIGSFQALQHRAARMRIDLELLRSCVESALRTADHASDRLSAQSALAKAMAAQTVHLVSNEMIQMHGGIGMTDAHDAGLYLKRARVLEMLYGDAAYHHDRYASLHGY